MTRHEQVRVRPTGFPSFTVDRELAPLIGDLWRLRLLTQASCQGDDGKAQIVFARVMFAEEFLRIVYEAEADDALRDLENHALAWRVLRAVPGNMIKLGGDWQSELCCATFYGPLGFALSVWFPRDDLPEVARRVRAEVERRAAA